VLHILSYALLFQSQVSDLLHNFIGRMLVKDPMLRATASELLLHPFLKTTSSLKSLVMLSPTASPVQFVDSYQRQTMC